MFEKILKHEKEDLSDPDIPNRGELLKEIRNNNCREILAMNVTIKVLTKDLILYPDRAEAINNALKMAKGKKRDLLIGVEYIDQELNEISKRVKK